MQGFAAKFYASRAWHQCRASFIAQRIAIDGGVCQRCGERMGVIVHHTVQLTPENIEDPSIALNHERLEYLCLDCHNMEPGHFLDQQGKGATARYRFDADGEIVPRSPQSSER